VERGEYERLARVEERGWWFRALRRNLIAAWRSAAPCADQPRVLDAGCGTGGFLAALKQADPSARRFGVDLDPIAVSLAAEKSGAAVALGSINALPFANTFDAVFSADVLSHRGVEPSDALRNMTDALKPGGVVVLNLPAYRWLLSGHDHAVDNVRRFGRGEVRALLAAAGLSHIRVGYWNSILFPIMVLQRLTHRGGASDVELLPRPMECLFAATVLLEAGLAKVGLRFPFGGSILATAVKP
jgi:SAM-dependent methyltransferase